MLLLLTHSWHDNSTAVYNWLFNVFLKQWNTDVDRIRHLIIFFNHPLWILPVKISQANANLEANVFASMIIAVDKIHILPPAPSFAIFLYIKM